MRSTKDMKDFYRKENIVVKHCEECGNDYEEYDLYIQNKHKGRMTDCNHCIQERERKKMEEEQSRLLKRQQCHDYHKLSEIPFELKGSDFDSYEPNNETQKKAKELTIKFANGELEKTTLFFQGDTGLGKSHLSYCVYKKYADKYERATFIDLPSFLNKIRNSFGYSDSAQNQEKMMSIMKTADLLVLDDIGAEYVKPDANGYESWAADILFQIVNSRLGKKTIYTTNFTSKHLTKKYGMMSKRIISRMMSNAQVIKVDGEDHRLRGLD